MPGGRKRRRRHHRSNAHWPHSMPKREGKTSAKPRQILRHNRRKAPEQMVVGDEALIQRLEKHIAKHIGEPETVFHEIVSDLVHIDVHIVAPRAGRNFYTLITSGMSGRPMRTPPGLEEFAYAELLLCLPPEWPMDQDAWTNESNYWPIRLLKFLARMPHEYETWLSYHHSIPNDDAPKPYARNTRFSGALLLPPSHADEKFLQCRLGSKRVVNFLAVYPVYPEEMKLKLSRGIDTIYERFEKHDITEVINLTRVNTAKVKTR